MSYYDTGYEYGGYPVYVGTGFDEAWYYGLPPLSYVEQYEAVSQRGRFEVSAKEVLGHAAMYQAMNWGATYALRKGFLDATLMGYMHGGRLYGNMTMAMRMTMRAGMFQIARKALPGAMVSSAIAGFGYWVTGWYHDVTGGFLGYPGTPF